MYYIYGRNEDIDAYIFLIRNAINTEKEAIIRLGCNEPTSMELCVGSKYEDFMAHFFQNAFERYVSDYIEWNTRPARNKSIEYQINTIKEKTLSPLEAQRAQEMKRLSTLNGIFNASKRKDCKNLISRIEARINSALTEISALEAKAAQNERERELEIATFRTLSDEDIREKAREAAIKVFRESFEATMFLLKNQQNQKAEPPKPIIYSSYGAEPAKPITPSSYGAEPAKSTYSPVQDTVYTIEPSKGSTFTGNQLEDYGKVRDKILSGEITTEELREFEIKWGYPP